MALKRSKVKTSQALPGNTGVTAGSYTTADITVNADGTISAAANGSGGGGITQLTGDVTAGPGSGSQAATLANTAVTPASYTNTNLTVDAKGRITAASNGSGGSSGALILLEQHTASLSATLDFTSWYSSTYDEYQIEIVNLIPATNSQDLKLRFSTNGGSSYDAGNNYYWFGAYSSNIGSGAIGGGPVDAISLGPSIGNGFEGISGSFKIFNPGDGSLRQHIMNQVVWAQSGSVGESVSGGMWTTTTAVNAFRLLFASGNIASGTVRVYGIAK